MIQQRDARSGKRLYVLLRYPKLSETFIRNEIQGLRKLGVGVDVISIEPGESENIAAGWAGDFRRLARPQASRAAVDHLWFALRHSASYLRFLRALVRLQGCRRMGLLCAPTEARRLRLGDRPDGCHTHLAFFNASMAVYLGRLLDVPVSVTVHAIDIYTADEQLRVRLSHCDRIVTVCNFNIGLLSGIGVSQVGDGAVDLVPCGVLVPDLVSRPDQPIDVISVGRLVEKKGFDTFIRAMALVCKSRAGTRATIVGDGPERAALTELISQLGLQRNVTLAGAKSHAETLESIGQAKVFCLASQRARNGDCDAVPVVIREAMARAVAVVATRVGGIPETVDDEVGWIVEPGSPEQLAGAIADALANERERTERGAAARTRVLRHWTVEAQAKGMLRVFERL